MRTPIEGSYTCLCKTGFDGEFCTEDNNECSTDETVCNQNAACTNTFGSYTCSCKEGYFGDGISCLPGQCPDSTCPKNQKCVSETTFDCECKNGFVLNLTDCVDYDECEENRCNDESECVNTAGSFTCTKLQTTTDFTIKSGHGFILSIF